ITPSVAEQEGQQTETEATGAPQKHHYTLNQQVGSITVRRCCSLSAAAGLPRPFLSMTTPGFAQAQSPQGPAPAKGIFEKAIHTVNK
ncbi:hypothetical protein ACSNLN_26765, partial [Klebsiella pneumoniae]